MNLSECDQNTAVKCIKDGLACACVRNVCVHAYYYFDFACVNIHPCYGLLLSGRIKPGCESELPGIEEAIKCKLEKVVWLPGFYAIPPHVQIASLDVYRQGKVR